MARLESTNMQENVSNDIMDHSSVAVSEHADKDQLNTQALITEQVSRTCAPANLTGESADRAGGLFKIDQEFDTVENKTQKIKVDELKFYQYSGETFKYLRQSEVCKRPRSRYLESNQKNLSPMMRGILVDWMVEVAEEYKLQSATL